MISNIPELEHLRDRYRYDLTVSMYQQYARLQLLRLITQGTEFLMLATAFLMYYLLDCMLQATRLPTLTTLVS